MANTPVPNKMMKSDEPLPPGVRKGDDKYDGFMRQWISENKPGYLTVGNYTYQVLQWPETGEYWFKPIDPQSMYQSRSF